MGNYEIPNFLKILSVWIRLVNTDIGYYNIKFYMGIYSINFVLRRNSNQRMILFEIQ